MKSLNFTLLIIWLAMILTACGKNESTLVFELPADFNNPIKVIYYASDKRGGKIIETVAEIREGKGSIVLPMVYPAVVFLFNGSQQDPGLIIYAERGDKIVISGKDDSIADWNVAGNKLDEQYSEWRAANVEALKKNNPELLNASIKKYVEENPDSQLSLFLLSYFYDRRIDAAGFEKLYSSLGRKAFGNKKMVRAFAVADLNEGVSRYSIPKSLILTGQEGWLDTLRLGGKPAWLIFRNNKDRTAYTTENDSIRALCAAFPDSLDSHIIAEIFMDSDSLSWRRGINLEALQGVKRMWMPLGLNDSLATTSGITRMPFYIVAGSKGELLYSGSDLKSAVDIFRKTR